jgi:hypothetical protein
VQLSETHVGLVLGGSQIVKSRSPVLKQRSLEHIEAAECLPPARILLFLRSSAHCARPQSNSSSSSIIISPKKRKDFTLVQCHHGPPLSFFEPAPFCSVLPTVARQRSCVRVSEAPFSHQRTKLLVALSLSHPTSPTWQPTNFSRVVEPRQSTLRTVPLRFSFMGNPCHFLALALVKGGRAERKGPPWTSARPS